MNAMLAPYVDVTDDMSGTLTIFEAAAFHDRMRQRGQAQPAEARRKAAEDVGGEVDAEVDAGEADQQDRRGGDGVHDGLRGDGTVLDQMMRDDRVRRC